MTHVSAETVCSLKEVRPRVRIAVRSVELTGRMAVRNIPEAPTHLMRVGEPPVIIVYKIHPCE